MAEDVIEPIPRNRLLGVASDGLRTARTKLDYVPLPEFLGGGLGHLLVGQAPEEVNEWSYGNSPFYEFRGDNVLPHVRPERAQGLVDTALLPAAEAVGVAKLAGRGLRGMAETASRAVNAPASVSRRKFVKDAGTVAAGSTAAAAVPAVVKMLDKRPATAAKVVANGVRRWGPPVFKPFTGHPEFRQLYDMGVRDFNKAYEAGDDAYEEALINSFGEPPYFGDVPDMGAERPRLQKEFERRLFGDDASPF